MISGISRNAGDVIAEIKMTATVFPGSFILVEGASDSRFIRPRINKINCETVICGSKPVVIEVAKSAKGTPKKLGIVDDDFDRALNIVHGTDDLVLTDTHDIETLLLSSSALDKIIGEYADHGSLSAFLAKEGDDFRSALLRRATPFGKYRLLNAIHNFGVPFAEQFSPWKYVDHRNWNLDVTKLEADFVLATTYDLATVRSLEKQLPKVDPWNLIQGHDAMAILAIAMRSVLGVKISLSEERLSAALRLAFDDMSFQSTKLFAKMKQWENIKSVTLF